MAQRSAEDMDLDRCRLLGRVYIGSIECWSASMSRVDRLVEKIRLVMLTEELRRVSTDCLDQGRVCSLRGNRLACDQRQLYMAGRLSQNGSVWFETSILLAVRRCGDSEE